MTFFTVTERGKGVIHKGSRYAAVRALMASAGEAWRRVHATWDGHCGVCRFCKFKTPRQLNWRLEVINNRPDGRVHETTKENAVRPK